MADRRAVRSSSRRMTPTPQPPSKADTPQAGRATRRRGTRSASRDVEAPVEAIRPTRRSARGASVASVASEGEQEREPATRTERKGQKKAIRDLTTVEEIDTQIAIEDAPATPPRPEAEVAVPHRSPGAISEMSGTTAISSFSIVEAEMLDSRLILRHLPKLYEEVDQFLNHLVPADGRIEHDNQHIKDMQMPDSDFVADYNDYNEVLTPRLNRFRGEHQQYINLRAVHRALFGPNRDYAASQSGLDLVLYLANALVFAKEWIHSDRNDKEMWTALRELDNLFPALFLPALMLGSNSLESPSGDSALLQETFELALDLRTQLAILYLERESNEEDNGDNFNPDDALEEVFFQSNPAQGAGHSSIIRGWGISALGGEDSALPQAFQSKVIERLSAMRQFFLTDKESLKTGNTIDIDSLGSNFPWNSVILRLLGWVRLRSRELQAATQHHGGVAAIVEQVTAEMRQPSANKVRAASVLQASPRKKRTSFGRNRRRSSGKFDYNKDVNNIVMDKLIARERGSGAQPETASSQRVLQAEEEEIIAPQEQDDWQPPSDDEQQQPIEAEEEAVEEVAKPSRPPQSTAETLKLLKESKRLDKENRAVSLFERQATAQRVAFGDGFDDSQPTPGPSTRKGKQPKRSAPKKRPRQVEENDDEDAFEMEPRAAKVQERREKAKRVRIVPSSSGTPTSHQPPARDEDSLFVPNAQEESPSETEAPEMTEEAPPSSTFANQKQLARANRPAVAGFRPRKARTGWTIDAEEALIEYMGIYPQKYAQILQHDDTAEGYGVLQDRTQVNLKDKVRNMAITMIKSGAGLRPGFENVIAPHSSIGRKLIEDGFEW